MRAISSLSVLTLVALAVACGSNETIYERVTPSRTPSGAPPAGDETPAATGEEPDNGAVAPPDVQPQGPAPLAHGITVDDIALFQPVKVTIVKSGKPIRAAVRNAPVIAQRDALVRVYVKRDEDAPKTELTAELTISVDGEVVATLEDKKMLTQDSTDDSLDSTFNFEVKGEQLPTQATFSVAVRNPAGEPTEDADSPALFPGLDATVPFEAKSTGGGLRVVLVPVKYATDGSNRLPDTGPAQLDLYKRVMQTFYPTSTVDIRVGTPITWNSTISASGSGWSRMLQAVLSRRASDGPDDDVYYYGIFAPTASIQTFCGRGCVTGLSGVGDDPSDAEVRASIGVGFAGEQAALTMAHEVGHAHGRRHAPCGGAAGPDPEFPYTQGGIGVWGYNASRKELVSPSKGRDLMGYCEPEWISDYTFKALYERMIAVSRPATRRLSLAAPRTYRFVEVDEQGHASWGDSIALRHLPGGLVHTALYRTPGGTEALREEAHFYRYDHLPGGFFLVPEGPAGSSDVVLSGPAISTVLAR